MQNKIGTVPEETQYCNTKTQITIKYFTLIRSCFQPEETKYLLQRYYKMVSIQSSTFYSIKHSATAHLVYIEQVQPQTSHRQLHWENQKKLTLSLQQFQIELKKTSIQNMNPNTRHKYTNWVRPFYLKSLVFSACPYSKHRRPP